MEDITILDDPQFKEFVHAKDYKPKSIKNHMEGLKFYCNCIGKTPTEIIREAIDEQKRDVWVTDRKIRTYFTNFIDYLVKLGNAPQTIKNKVNWVKTFYKEYGIETPTVKIPANKCNIALKPIPDKEIIAEVLKYANIRNRAIIILMASSGMGSAEIRNLKYKDFLSAIDEAITDFTTDEKLNVSKIKAVMKDKRVFGTWEIVRQKTSIPYITFSTPESIQAIIDYLVSLNQCNDPKKSTEDYLFSINGEQMKANTLTQVFQNLNDRCGLGKTSYQRLFTSHNMRKFMANTLIDNGMDFYRVEWLLGHALPPTQASYYKMNKEIMKDEYAKYEDYLTIWKTVPNHEENNPAVQEMNKRMEVLERMFKEQTQMINRLLSDGNVSNEFCKMK